MGTTPAFLGIRGYRVQAGRFLEDADDADARRVAVLGARIAEALFPDGDAIGRELRLRGVPFQVIGTLAPKGAAADGGDEDGLLVMPIATAMRRVFNRSSISAIFVSAVDAGAMDDAGDAVARLVRVRHRPGRDGRDDFDVQNTARQIGRRRQTLGLLDGVTTGLAAVTMLAGGAGVFTLMWLSVADRTSEIGLRLAVGATQARHPGPVPGRSRPPDGRRLGRRHRGRRRRDCRAGHGDALADRTADGRGRRGHGALARHRAGRRQLARHPRRAHRAGRGPAGRLSTWTRERRGRACWSSTTTRA